MIRIIPWLFVLLAIPVLISAQDCGCYDCGIDIPFNSQDTFEFTFTDALNNNLANADQGICGVEMRFTHNRVRGLEITLISPAGQSVRLTGPNLPNPTSTTTINALWDILFVRTGDPASPDSGIPAVWSNASNWVIGGNYTGSYYPNSGNLEDFNTGSVNGTWRLVIHNYNFFNNYFGELINFRIILCDPSGIDCCFANAGTPTGDLSVRTCINDSDFLLTPEVVFGANPPDTSEYDYTWILGNDTVILDYDTVFDFSGFAVGHYEVCGFSYRIDHTDSIPLPDGTLRWDTLRNRLDMFDQPFCGNVADRCYEIIISDPPPVFQLRDTICIGETYASGDSTFTQSGNYFVVIPLATGCDSIVDLELTVLLPDTTFLNETICFGETYQVGDSIYSTSGSYINLFPTTNHCDSIVKLNLTVLPELETTVNAIICEGEEYRIGDSVLTAEGHYEILLISADGCDSLVIADLVVLNPQADIALPDTLTCLMPTVELDGSGSTSGGLLSFFWFTNDGSISSSVSEPVVTASAPGLYHLIVREDSAGYVCLSQDSVQVIGNFVRPTVNILSPDTLTCSRTSVTLNGSGSSVGPAFRYQWRRVGVGIIPGATTFTLNVNQPGTYRLIITDIRNGCADSTSVVVIQNIIPPIAEAGNGFEINCNVSSDTLDGRMSSTGSNFQYQWTGPGITCCATTLRPNVNRPGWYFLRVTNTRNGCVSRDSVRVTENITAPVAEAGSADTLDCLNAELILNGSGSAGLNFVYQWSTPNGRILRDGNTLNPAVDLPGIYYLTVTNTQNFCRSVDSVRVFEERLLPTADAGPDATINCNVRVITIGGSATSTGNEFSYSWFLNNSVVGNNATMAVSTGGEYVLEVINSLTGCASTDTVVIATDTIAPVAEAGNSVELTCSLTMDTLDGSASTSGQDIAYNWSTFNGCFLSSVDSVIVEIGCQGWYFLTVLNNENGCLSLDSVQVTQDEDLPVAFAGARDTLNCIDTSLMLGGVSFPPPPDAIIQWTTTTGNIVSGDTTLTPVINEPGIYSLIVTRRDNGCSIQSSVTILRFADVPLADAGVDMEINCDTSSVELGGPDSSTGASISYQWRDGNGLEIPGATDRNLTVADSGTYILEVIDNFSRCNAFDTVFVEIDTIVPLADAGDGIHLDCQQLEGRLDGSNSSTGSDLTYAWSTPDGNILADVTTLMPLVNAAGTYYLLVFNNDNHCFSRDSTEVTSDDNLPFIVLPEEIWLQCPDGEAAISAFGSSEGVNFVYQWTTVTGNILLGQSDTVVQVDAPGVYYFSVEDTFSHCVVTDSVMVRDTITPVADAGGDRQLDCNDLVSGILLDGNGSSLGPQFSYHWTTFGGNFLSDQDTLTPLINSPGLYNLLVINELNGCQSEDDILVSLSANIPFANAGPDIMVPCGDPPVWIDGSGSTGGDDVFYQWTTRLGHIISGSDSSQVLVDSNGVYVLTVTNIMSNCSVQDSVLVEFLPCGPQAIVLAPDTVTCSTDTVRLDGTGSSTTNSRFEWLTLSGSIVSDDNTLTPIVTLGRYRLTITDTTTNLSNSAEVEVIVDTLKPVADAGDPAYLTCLATSVFLDGTASSQPPGYDYRWSGPQPIQGETSLQPRVFNGGEYQLIVTDQRNGCMDTSRVSVLYDTLPPPVDAGIDMTFPCDTPFIRLDGSGNVMNPDYTYLWSTGDRVLSPLVFQPGEYCLSITNTLNGCESVDCVTVTPDQNAPDISGAPDGTLSCKDASTVIRGNIPAGNMEINWSGAPGCIDSDPGLADLTVSCPGTYTLTVRDNSNNCISSVDIIVHEDVNPPVSEAGASDTLSCREPATILNGTGSSVGNDFIYAWTGAGNILNEATLQPTVDAGGWFYLAVTDTTNGCVATDSVLVFYDTLAPISDAGPDRLLTCALDRVTLDGNLSSRNGPYIYEWTSLSGNGILSGGATLQPVVNEASTYILEVTDTLNGCASTDSIIVLNDRNDPVVVINHTGTLTINCSQDTLHIDASGSTPSGNLVFRWSTLSGQLLSSAVDPLAIVGRGGWYFLTVENPQNGCIARDSIFVIEDLVNPPLNIIIPEPITCLEDTVIVQVELPDSITDYSALWTTQTGNIISGQNTLSISVDQPTRYTVHVINNVNGCETTTSVNVPADTIPPVAVAEVAGVFDCLSEEIELDGSGSSIDGSLYNYLWSSSGIGNITNPASLHPIVDAPGWYVLQVRNTRNGCIAVDSVSVGENTSSIVEVAVDINAVTCFGRTDGKFQVTSVTGGTGPYTYALNDSIYISQNEFANLAPGFYNLSIQDAAGCEFDTTIFINSANELLVDLGTDLTLQLGDSAELEALINIPLSQIDTFIWAPEEEIHCPGCQVQWVHPEFSTLFTVRVRDTLGCEATDAIQINVLKERPVYIPSGFSPNGDGNNEKFMVFGGTGIANIDRLLIFDRWGNLLYEAENLVPNDTNLGWDGTFNGQLMNTGVYAYMVEITFTDGKTEIFKGDITLWNK